MSIAFKQQGVDYILNHLADTITEVNFRELAGPLFQKDQERKLGHKHYIICTVEHLLKIAQEEGYDLCKRYGSIYVYNGTYWELAEDDDLKSLLGVAAERMGVDLFNARHYKFRNDLFLQFLSSGKFQYAPTNQDAVLINLANGTYEIGPNTQHLREHGKADFLMYQLPFPLYKKFL